MIVNCFADFGFNGPENFIRASQNCDKRDKRQTKR